VEEKHVDFYHELRKRVHAWAATEQGQRHRWIEYVLLAPDFLHLLCKLAIDSDVPTQERAKLAVAIAYFLSPIDIMPEALLGPAGYADDIALAAYVLNGIINKTDPSVVTRHWAGDGDVLDLIKDVVANADNIVGSGLWKRLRRLV
jgi:uncharacterized membrane protein YkvA (DUF1232 family)